MSDDARQKFRQAVAAHREKDYPSAVALCDAILADLGASPQVLNLKAIALAESGQMVLARKAILQALDAANESGSDDMRGMLCLHAARILTSLDLYSEALRFSEQAVALKPGDSACAYQHARAALLYGDLELAEHSVRACVERFPGFTEAKYLLAQVASEKGELSAAEKAYFEIVEEQPRQARAWAGLAEIRKSTRDDEFVAGGLGAIHEAGVEQELSPGDWSTATFALADACGKEQWHERAFELYRAANLHLAEDKPWDIDAWEKRMRDTINRATKLADTDSQEESPAPLFIVGMPRSGSSLLERMLGAHSEVSGGGERESMLHIQRYFDTRLGESSAAGTGISPELVEEARSLYRAGFGSGTDDLSRVCDKANMNFERIGLIRRLFPESRIIWIVRNPLDTILSCYFQDFQHGLGFTNSLDHLARVHIGHWTLMRKWMECFGESIEMVQYEHLVREPREIIEKLCIFLGLAFESQMLEPQRQKQVVRTASTLQVQQPINTRSVGRWHPYENRLAGIIDMLRTENIIDGHMQLMTP